MHFILRRTETPFDELKAMPTDEQLTMFHKLGDLQSATTADDARTAYKAELRDGITAIIDVMG